MTPGSADQGVDAFEHQQIIKVRGRTDRIQVHHVFFTMHINMGGGRWRGGCLRVCQLVNAGGHGHAVATCQPRALATDAMTDQHPGHLILIDAGDAHREAWAVGRIKVCVRTRPRHHVVRGRALETGPGGSHRGCFHGVAIGHAGTLCGRHASRAVVHAVGDFPAPGVQRIVRAQAQRGPGYRAIAGGAQHRGGVGRSKPCFKCAVGRTRQVPVAGSKGVQCQFDALHVRLGLNEALGSVFHLAGHADCQGGGRCHQQGGHHRQQSPAQLPATPCSAVGMEMGGGLHGVAFSKQIKEPGAGPDSPPAPLTSPLDAARCHRNRRQGFRRRLCRCRNRSGWRCGVPGR